MARRSLHVETIGRAWPDYCTTNTVKMDKVSSAVTGAAVKSLIQPHPGTGILKYWQGIVEIILRIVSLVSRST